jgi:hypothetical protein
MSMVFQMNRPRLGEPKPSRMRSIFLALAVILSAVPVMSLAGTAYVGHGEARVENKKKVLAARDLAYTAAVRDAVDKALRAYLSETAYQEGSVAISTQLLPAAVGYAKTTDIVDEVQEGEIYKITVRCDVDMDGLRDALRAVGVSTDVGTRRTIMVLVDEYFSADLAPDASPQVARILDVVDQKAVATEKSASSQSSAKATATAEASSAASHSEGAVDASYAAKAKMNIPDVGSASQSESAKIKGNWNESNSSSASKASVQTASNSRAQSSYSHADSSRFEYHLTEYFPPEMMRRRQEQSACAAALSRELQARDVNLVDQAAVTNMRDRFVGPDGVLANFLSDDGKVREIAMAAASGYSADAAIIGCVSVIYNGVNDQGLHVSTANLAVKVCDASSGQILATAANSQSGVSSTAQSSAVVAAQRLGQLIGADLSEQLYSQFVRRDEKGSEITLHFRGVNDTRTKIILIREIKKVGDVADVTERVFDRPSGVLEVSLVYKGGVSRFKNDFLEKVIDVPELATIEEQTSLGQTLSFVLGTP